MKAKFIKPKMIRILNSLSIDMVLIKKGSFLMGEGDEAKKVKIKEDFYMGKYPITIAEYMHFVKDTHTHHPKWLEDGNKYHIKTGTDDHYKKMDLSDNAPIIGVSWHDAVAYAKWLSEKTGESYRLPTEAEWEYSCHAGTTTKWSFGDDEKELTKYAWYDENSDGKTHPVGEKLPNPWGLYDMHGLIWEWCEDWYDEDKKHKVLRGGSFYKNADLSSSISRSRIHPDYHYNRGFRLLRTLPFDKSKIIKILWLDDDTLSIDYEKMIIEEELNKKVKVYTFESIKDLLEFLDTHTISNKDIFIIDIVLPFEEKRITWGNRNEISIENGISAGIELYKKFLKKKYTKNPIIFYSGIENNDVKAYIRNNIHNAYILNKHEKPEKLLKLLNLLISKP